MRSTNVTPNFRIYRYLKQGWTIANAVKNIFSCEENHIYVRYEPREERAKREPRAERDAQKSYAIELSNHQNN